MERLQLGCYDTCTHTNHPPDHYHIDHDDDGDDYGDDNEKEEDGDGDHNDDQSPVMTRSHFYHHFHQLAYDAHDD